MGLALKRLVRNFWVGVMAASLLGLLAAEANAQSLYNITFSQFAAGTVYTNAGGPPSDFSSYAPSGSDAMGVYSEIVQYYSPSLTNLALACNNAGQGVGNFLMSMGNVSSNIVTLNTQLLLDSVVGATVVFGQTGPPGSNVTSIILSFPETPTNTMQVQSLDGPSGSPTVLYSFATGLVRSDLQNISFSLNLSTSMFSLTVNGVSLANNARIGSHQPLNQAAISIGDTAGTGTSGTGVIGDTVLTAVPIPEIAGISFSGTNVLVGLITSTNAHYDVQTTTDLASGAWSMLYSNVPGTGGLTNINCGYTTGPQRFYRVAAHP